MSKTQKKKRSQNGLIPRIKIKLHKIAKKLMKNTRLLKLSVIAIVSILLTIFVVIKVFADKNAIAVFLDETEIGVIAKDKNITSEYLQTLVISKLEAYNDTKIDVNEKVSFIPIHSKKNNIVSQDHIISEIYNAYLDNSNYRVEALEISVDGNPLVIMKNDAEYKEIKDKIIEPYVRGNEKIIESDFYEEVTITKKFCITDSLYTKEDAYKKLSEVTEVPTKYIVKNGDIFSKIASNFGISSEELASINPQITSIASIKIGDEINIMVKKPLLSIRTVEETKNVEVEPKEIKNEINPEKRSDYKRLLQQGADGEAEVTYHVVKVNGSVVEKIPVSRNVIKESVPEIWEVGK